MHTNNSAPRAVYAALGILLTFLTFHWPTPAQAVDVLTYHYDLARTGQNLQEEILTPANVNSNHFGLLRVLATDGKVDAQPLYAAGVNIPGKGWRNVLFIATEHDSVYGFDADTGETLWQVSLCATNETPTDDRFCPNVTPEIGITATPVIDRQFGTNGAMFVVAASKDANQNYYHRLYALDLATGAALLTPTAIQATYPGIGDNSTNGSVVFDPAQVLARASLLLYMETIVTCWASHCDFRPYTGWMIGFDEHTLAQTQVFNVTPNGNDGGIWMAGGAPAVDPQGFMYVLVGNGTLDTNFDAAGFPVNQDFGNSFLKLSLTPTNIIPVDYFAPYNTLFQNAEDLDLGTTGPLILPDLLDAQGNLRQLAIGGGKDGTVYVVDRSNLGKYNPLGDAALYQEVGGYVGYGLFTMPAYFNGTVYFGALFAPLIALPLENARLGKIKSQSDTIYGYPGATPIISANGTNNGILWATENQTPVILRAYDPADLAHVLYGSYQTGQGRDLFGAGNKFITPVVANARVYVAAAAGVGVFGLLDQDSLTPLQKWRDDHFGNPSNIGAGADGASPSGDGIPNLLKYALGLDPKIPAFTSQWMGTSTVTENEQSYLAITINRTQQTDIAYGVEVSDDLETWFSGAPYTKTLVDTPQQLIVRDNKPIFGSTAHFMRLAVRPAAQ